MRVLFCHDGPIDIDKEKNYYSTAFNDETFNRYYSIADELAVVIRGREVKGYKIDDKLSKITVKPFELIIAPNVSSLRGQLFNKKITKKIISEEVGKSDYVIARLPSFIGNIAIKMAIKHNKPYLIEVAGCAWDAFWNYSLVGKFVAPIMYLTTKRNIKNAPYAVYVTNEFLQYRYPTTGKNTNCSNVALTEFDDTILHKRIEKIEGKNHKEKIIIGTTAAVDVRYKGQQYVIEALSMLKEAGMTNFEYQLVGEGDQTYLKELAQKLNVAEQIRFIGSLSHAEVFKWLETIDIYTQPSRQEGLPRALIEAMSRAVPAFGARTAGIPELLDEKFIFSNTKKNIDEIIEILKSFDKETMIKQASRNYEDSKKYDKRIIEERRRKFFEEFKRSLDYLKTKK